MIDGEVWLKGSSAIAISSRGSLAEKLANNKMMEQVESGARGVAFGPK